MGEFEKKFQDIANKIPLFILDVLHKKKQNPIYIPDTFLKVVNEAREELDLILNDPIRRDGTPSIKVRVTAWKKKWLDKDKGEQIA